jgi:hypothetical protein
VVAVRQVNPGPQPCEPVVPLQSSGCTIAGVPGFVGMVGTYGVWAACAWAAIVNEPIVSAAAATQQFLFVFDDIPGNNDVTPVSSIMLGYRGVGDERSLAANAAFNRP